MSPKEQQSKNQKAKNESVMSGGIISHSGTTTTTTPKATTTSNLGGTVENPLASAESEKIPEMSPAPIYVPDEALDYQADPQDTARAVSSVVSVGCAWVWRDPLTDTENADLTRDLAAVLRKYEVPNLPVAEEVQLICTVGGIIGRRWTQNTQETAENVNNVNISEHVNTQKQAKSEAMQTSYGAGISEVLG